LLEKVILYKTMLNLLENPTDKETILLQSNIPSHIGLEALKRLEQLLREKRPSLEDFEKSISGLSSACSLGMVVSDRDFILSLKSHYEKHGFEISEQMPVDYLPAMLAFFLWIYFNASYRIADKIEKETVKNWGIVILEEIINCLEKKGLTDSFYYSVLRILLDYWRSL